MDNCFLSIVVPVYNVENELNRFIDSLNIQTSKNFEVIFVNDGSTDRSESSLKKCIKKFPNVIINQNNCGSGKARNKGFEIAKGKYLFFADPDDFLESDLVQTIESNIIASTDVMIFGYYSHNKGLKKKIINKTSVFLNSSDLIEKNFVEIEDYNNFNSVWNKIYNREFLNKSSVIFSAHKTAQDAIFNYNLLNKVNSLQVLSEPLYNYLSDRVGSAQSKKKMKYKDEFVLMRTKMKCFESWKFNKKYLLDLAVIDFFMTQIISFKGDFPEYFKVSTEYHFSSSLLKEIRYNKDYGLFFFIKLFLLKTQSYKILYTIYRFFL